MRQKRRFVCSIVAGLALVATNAYAQAAERPVNFSFGIGWTSPNSEVNDHLGNGYNINIGLQGNITPTIALEGLYSFNGLGDKTRLVDVADTPGGVDDPPRVLRRHEHAVRHRVPHLSETVRRRQTVRSDRHGRLLSADQSHDAGRRLCARVLRSVVVLLHPGWIRGGSEHPRPSAARPTSACHSAAA